MLSKCPQKGRVRHCETLSLRSGGGWSLLTEVHARTHAPNITSSSHRQSLLATGSPARTCTWGGRQEGGEGAPAGPRSSLGTHRVPGPLQEPGANLTETAAVKEPARLAVAVMSERKPVLHDKACLQEKPAYQSLPDSSHRQLSCHTWGPGQPERGTCTHSPGHRLAEGLSPTSAGLCARAPCVCALSDLRPPRGGGYPLEQRKRWLREVCSCPKLTRPARGSLQKPLCPKLAILVQAGHVGTDSSLSLPQAAHAADRPWKQEGWDA